MGYGNPTDVLPKIAESYQEAKMALEVGRLFYVEKEIMADVYKRQASHGMRSCWIYWG